MIYGLRFWSLGRLYWIPEMDKDAALTLFDILSAAKCRVEVYHGLDCIKAWPVN